MSNNQYPIKLILTFILAFALIGAGCSNNQPEGKTDNPNDGIASGGLLNTDMELANQDGSDTETTLGTKAKTAVIKYTQYGFMPDPMIINVGDSIEFQNASEDSFRPMADDVSFDAEKPLDTNQSFKFTFTKTGEVEYHNHLDPSKTGTIIVR